MNSDEMTSASYLHELYNATQGNPETQVSMHDIGFSIGIEKSEAGRIAQELMVQGYIDLKTLAGGISITNEGLSSLGFTPSNSNDQKTTLQLSTGPVVNDEDRHTIEKIVSSIKIELSSQAQDYKTTEQTVLDLKVIELHLLSPAPKTSVFLELFRSLTQSFEGNTAMLNISGLSTIIS